nr:MAG TPA_asm: hypothetical protein [Bacteriophage sp.]
MCRLINFISINTNLTAKTYGGYFCASFYQ